MPLETSRPDDERALPNQNPLEDFRVSVRLRIHCLSAAEKHHDRVGSDDAGLVVIVEVATSF
jgi:hypothetical protein